MNPFATPPEKLAETRQALHRLAAYVIAPVRHTATGRFGLRATNGGFGTPEFDGRLVRVEGGQLIDSLLEADRRHEITSLEEAAAFLGAAVDAETAAEHDSPAVGDRLAVLPVDAESSTYLGDWFAMAFAGLGTVAEDDSSVDASEPQLWPGHFDAAIEVGDENHRASYGASPGDHGIDEPYIYVSVWWPDKIDIDQTETYWNAAAFVGATRRLSEFPEGLDPIAVATDFWRSGRDRLLAN